MNFKDPFYLLLIPVVLILSFLKLRQKGPGIKYSLSNYLKKNLPVVFPYKKLLIVLRIAAVLLLVIALSRPRNALRERNVIKPSVDIMLVMDVSTSMNALDFAPQNRMDAAKAAAKEFIKVRTSDRIGLVVFSGLPLLQCPLTLDNKAVLRLMDIIEAGMIKVDGTSIGLGVSLGLKYLEKSDSPSKVMVLLTDGANNTGDIDPITAAEMAKSLNIKIYTIGAGRPGPSQIPVEHPYFGTQLVTIPDELDEPTLKRIADMTGGKYFRAKSIKELNSIYKEIDTMEKKSYEINEYFEFEERYFFYLILGLCILLMDIVLKIFFPGMFI